MKTVALILLFAVMGSISVFAQPDVEYKHRTLVRTLQKAGVSDMSELQEIILTDSVKGSGLLQGKYFLINGSNKENYKYIYVGRVNSCRSGSCSLSETATGSISSEYFDYYILYDNDKSVQAVKVFNYQATHGHEITARGWLKQFTGHKEPHKLEVGENIDAISGATISVNAITEDIKLKTILLKNI